MPVVLQLFLFVLQSTRLNIVLRFFAVVPQVATEISMPFVMLCMLLGGGLSSSSNDSNDSQWTCLASHVIVMRLTLGLSPGENSGVWFLDLKSGAGSTGKGEAPVKADVVMSMDSGVFSKMFAGELSQQQQQEQQQRLCGNSHALCAFRKAEANAGVHVGEAEDPRGHDACHQAGKTHGPYE